VVTYCIAAHTRPGQTRRLIDRLLTDDPNCKVVFHYDQRQERLDLQELVDPRITILPERPANWGTFGMVEVFMEMMRAAVAERNCSYLVLLSGQDYPLRNISDLESELAQFDVWADVRPLIADGGATSWPEGLRRYSYRWRYVANPGLLLEGLDRVAAKVPGIELSSSPPPFPRIVHFRQRGQLWWGYRDLAGPGTPIYVGSSWMSLSRRAALAVLSTPRRVVSFFRRVPMPDEACFHTILGNAAGLTFATGNRRFIRFDEKESPEILTIYDLEMLLQSGAHFARKFDDQIDGTVLDLLDARLDGAK